MQKGALEANVPLALLAGVQEKSLHSQTRKHKARFLRIRPLVLIASYYIGQLRMELAG